MDKQQIVTAVNQWIKSNPHKSFMFASSIERSKKKDCVIAIHIFPEMGECKDRKKMFDQEEYDLSEKEITKLVNDWYDNHFDNERSYEITTKEEYSFTVLKKATSEERAKVDQILNPQKVQIEKNVRPPRTIQEILNEIKEEEEHKKAVRDKEREEQKAIRTIEENEEVEIEIVQQGLIQVEIKKKKQSNRGKKPQYDWSELKELYKKYGEHYDKIAEVIGCSAAAVRRRINLGQI